MIKTKNIDRRYKRRFLPVTALTGVNQLNEAAPNTRGQYGDTDMLVQHVNSLLIPGLLMNNDGEVATHWEALPQEWDWKQPVFIRLWWTCASTDTADTVLWKVFYEKLAANGALTATINDALDTVLATDTAAASGHRAQCTSWGKINRNTVNPTTTDLLLWGFEMDTKDTDMAENLWLLGVEWAYMELFSADNATRADVAANQQTPNWAADPVNQ